MLNYIIAYLGGSIIIPVLPKLGEALGSIILALAMWRISGGVGAFLRAHAEATRHRAYMGNHERGPLISVPVSLSIDRSGMTPAARDLPPSIPLPGLRHQHPSPHVEPAQQRPQLSTYLDQPAMTGPYTQPAPPSFEFDHMAALAMQPEHRIFFNRHLRVKS